jgi:hypothetical protein
MANQAIKPSFSRPLPSAGPDNVSPSAQFWHLFALVLHALDELAPAPQEKLKTTLDRLLELR